MPVSASVRVGATTTLTFSTVPEDASDKTVSVASSSPDIATVTLSGMVATVKGVKAGSTSIVGMTAGGAQVAVAGITVNGD